jgi:hypothetical protein
MRRYETPANASQPKLRLNFRFFGIAYYPDIEVTVAVPGNVEESSVELTAGKLVTDPGIGP